MKILIIVTKGPARNAYSIADAGGEIGGAQNSVFNLAKGLKG